MPTISLSDVRAHAPDVILPPCEEYAELYAERVAEGRQIARESRVAFLAICRNAMPFLPLTLQLVENTASMFADWSCFVYENDSSDDTKDCLGLWQDGEIRHASLNINGRPHLNFTTDPVRTIALAEYRSKCQLFVRQGEPVEWVIVFDTDPWGGFSIDGVLNTLAWMKRMPNAVGMASYSWCQWGPPVWQTPTFCHYDAFAARLNHWKQRDQLWFHLWHPPVGSPPVKFNSAFGQLAVYRYDSFIHGKYSGEDCEHVTVHRSLGGDFFLNPSQRVCSFWIPNDSESSNLHGDIRKDVVGRNPDEGDSRDLKDLGGQV